MNMLQEGKKAPAFKLPNEEGDIVSLKDFDSDYIVLFFYPKDLTPGCIIEAEGFTEKVSTFKKLKTTVLGISGQDSDSKKKFCEKKKLKVSLLADEDFAVSKKFGVYGKKSFMGKTFNGINRATFVIDSKGKIVKVFDKVKPAEHPQEVIDFIKSL